jgi:hypothetical protein
MRKGVATQTKLGAEVEKGEDSTLTGEHVLHMNLNVNA